MHPFSVVSLVHREGLTGVVTSQVIRPLREISRAVPCRIVFTLPPGHWLRSGVRRDTQTRLASAIAQSDISVSQIPVPPRSFPKIPESLFLRGALNRIVRGSLRDSGCVILHCRNSEATCLALNAIDASEKRVRLVYDARGAEPAELRQRLQMDEKPDDQLSDSERTVIRSAEERERKAFQESHAFISVSTSLIGYLESRHGSSSHPRLIQPCLADTAQFVSMAHMRDKVRTELGLDQKFVVCYLGSLEWYQKPELGIQWFRKICEVFPDAHLLAVTTQPEKFRSLSESLGLRSSSVTAMKVPSVEVPRILNAADLGLMLRDATIVNQVASPVKFAEYMAAGVPVLISNAVGDYTAAVVQNQLGVVVRSLEVPPESISDTLRALHQLRLSRSEIANRCRQYACENLSWDSGRNRLTEFYEAVAATCR